MLKLPSVDLLAHPMRLAILRFLVANDTASPMMLARELGVPVENVSYHVRRMAEIGVIKLDRQMAVRGAIEHFYRLDPSRVEELVNELRALANELKKVCVVEIAS